MSIAIRVIFLDTFTLLSSSSREYLKCLLIESKEKKGNPSLLSVKKLVHNISVQITLSVFSLLIPSLNANPPLNTVGATQGSEK